MIYNNIWLDNLENNMFIFFNILLRLPGFPGMQNLHTKPFCLLMSLKKNVAKRTIQWLKLASVPRVSSKLLFKWSQA